MKHATLCFILDGTPPRRILLGRKKRGFGEGKLNGFGGKIEPGETIRAAAVREIEEESRLVVPMESLQAAGTVTFRFPYEPRFDHHVHVFLTTQWRGRPLETAEMAPEWFSLEAIPYNRMWNDDAYWLPEVLSGNTIQADFSFAKDNETVASWSLHPLS